jgi:hypothetical protein
MKALLWTGYGIPSIYILNEHNFDIVKVEVLDIVEPYYENENVVEIRSLNNWGHFVQYVRDITYGDESFDKFEIVEVNE